MDVDENHLGNEAELETVNLDKDAMADSSDGSTSTKPIYIIQDKHDLEGYVVKSINRQEISENDLTTLEEHYFDNVKHYVGTVDKINRYFWTNLDDFINTRISMILALSEHFSQTVYEKLSAEERDMYTQVCKLVDLHRRTIDSKVRIQK